MNSVQISETLEVINYQNKLPGMKNSRNFESLRSQVSKIPDDSSENLRRFSSNIPIAFHFDKDGNKLFDNDQKLNSTDDLSFDPHDYKGFDPDFVL
jgi:hypothetical protein